MVSMVLYISQIYFIFNSFFFSWITYYIFRNKKNLKHPSNWLRREELWVEVPELVTSYTFAREKEEGKVKNGAKVVREDFMVFRMVELEKPKENWVWTKLSCCYLLWNVFLFIITMTMNKTKIMWTSPLNLPLNLKQGRHEE